MRKSPLTTRALRVAVLVRCLLLAVPLPTTTALPPHAHAGGQGPSPYNERDGHAAAGCLSDYAGWPNFLLGVLLGLLIGAKHPIRSTQEEAGVPAAMAAYV